MTGTYIQTVLALIFVLILIFATSFLLKKRQGKTGFMSIVGYQPIGPKKGVAALKIGKEVLILGITASEMRLLKVIQEADVVLPEKEDFQNKFNKFKFRIKAENK